MAFAHQIMKVVDSCVVIVSQSFTYSATFQFGLVLCDGGGPDTLCLRILLNGAQTTVIGYMK